VQPERWGAENVQAVIGATWVPGDVYAAFADHLLGGKHEVAYAPLTNTFDFSWDRAVKVTADKLRQWGTDDAPFSWIYSRLMNSMPLKIKKTIYENGKERTVVDEEATAVVGVEGAGRSTTNSLTGSLPNGERAKPACRHLQ
jgi:N12 class adenine-specific DNA methylase